MTESQRHDVHSDDTSSMYNFNLRSKRFRLVSEQRKTEVLAAREMRLSFLVLWS